MREQLLNELQRYAEARWSDYDQPTPVGIIEVEEVYDDEITYWPVVAERDFIRIGPWKNCVINVPRCDAPLKAGKDIGKPCQIPAGSGTDHFGVGRCKRHLGNRQRYRGEAAWLMAHAFAREFMITPWDALLMAVRVAAGKLMYAQEKIAEAQDDLELEGRFVRRTLEDGTLAMYHPDTGEVL